MRISYSALDSFTNCPAKYKFQYIDRIKTPKSKEAVFGTLIHECLKLFHQPGRPTPLEDELLRWFADKWNSDVYPNEQEESFAFHEGITLLKRYFQQNQGADFNIIDLETPFEASISDGQENHKIVGKIDRIDKLEDGTFELIDYKTAKKMPAQKKIDQNLQLSTYHLGLIERWPSLTQKPIKLSLYYLKHGEKLSTIAKRERIKETKEQILDLIKQIQESNFEPRQNALCDWCAFQPHCPLYKHKYLKEKTADDQKIEEVVSQFLQTKEAQEANNKKLAELKGLINQYLDQKQMDRVFGPDGYITRTPQKRFGYDINRVKETLQPIGKWEEVLAINGTKLRKVISSLPHDLKRQIEDAKFIENEFKTINAKKDKTNQSN